ncbi:MAG: hypothetical protein JOZ48_01150 [Acidobacteriaceae bacterium]|nr:hypothetical protein [Acidobacteriaceae bacterium]
MANSMRWRADICVSNLGTRPELGTPLDLHPSVLGAVRALDPAAEKVDTNLSLFSLFQADRRSV